MIPSPPKVALITGAARRIGAAIAHCLHQAGFDVMIHAHHAKQDAIELCQTLNERRPQSAACCFHDLQDSAAPAYLVEQTLQWRNALTLLVNNASVFIQNETTHPSPTTWEQSFKVNVEAPFYLSYAALPHLLTHEGSIINLTDIHATQPLAGYEIYCQTKAALTMQTLALAKAFAPRVRVNAVAPGAIAWPEGDNHLLPATKKNIISQTLLQRHGHPSDIAQTVLFLAQHAFMTGQVIKVDGGRQLHV
ncbi:MAG: pteridine reductase [Gammaproteobacteria bacterium]|nr:pteridine reductase [Gammaproteobacteria bacterium]